ncbi:MAG: VanZ family protein [Pseudomonadota bacterium]
MTRRVHSLQLVWHAVGPAMAAVIILLTLSAADSPLLVFSWWDKAMHFAGYAALGAWYVMVLAPTRYRQLWLLLVAMGIVLEGLQVFVPSRMTEGLDVLANVLGASAGVALGFTPWRHLLGHIERAILGRETH